MSCTGRPSGSSLPAREHPRDPYLDVATRRNALLPLIANESALTALGTSDFERGPPRS